LESRGVRHPVVAGYFYPEDPNELISLIEKSFLHPLGPGKLPIVSNKRVRSSIGYVAPHAGYIYSGPIAAHVYYKIAEEGNPDTFIIIGTNHTGLGSLVSVYPRGRWYTPLGYANIDEELSRSIIENSSIAEADTYAHIEEHSIEVQIPFLQYLYGENINIVPIVMGLHSPDAAKDLAKSIYESVKALGRDIVIIASSDFNHYEPHEITVEKDMLAIDKIAKLDTEGFYRVIIDRNISVCGPGAIMTLMEYAKLVSDNHHVELLKHATSGDVSGHKNAVVGYAAIRFLY